MRTALQALCGVAVAFLLSLSPSAQQGPATLPDTPAGRLMAEWLAACGATDPARLESWHQAHLRESWLKRAKPKAFAESDITDCRATGGFRVVEVAENAPLRLLVTAEGPKLGTWWRLLLSVDEAGKAGPIRSAPATPPESSIPAVPDDEALEREVSSLAGRLHAADRFSGIVMVARAGRPIATRAAGYADRGKQTPITPSSQFTIGSMGKMFTAAAAGQLVDQGKLSFDDTVGKFFPAFANQTIRDKVTLRMLLSHTSGMGSFLAARTPAMMKDGVKRADEFLPLYEKEELAFEPGSRWSYSNSGLALVGAIVEKVSGEDYPDYVRRHVLEPAGMTGSDPNNRPLRGERMVTPYTRQEPGGAAAQWQEAQRDIGSPAGGAVSTAEDLLKFAEALRGGKLMTRETFGEMAKAHENTPLGGYGYAMQVVDVYGRAVAGHGGGFPGVSTQLYIVLDSPYAAVVLANQDPPAAEMVGEKLRALLVKMAARDAAQAGKAAAGPEEVADVSGTWEGEAQLTLAGAQPRGVPFVAQFKQEGTKVEGTIGPAPAMQLPLTDVALAGRKLTFTAAMPLRVLAFEVLLVAPDRMEGKVTSEGGGEVMEGKVAFRRTTHPPSLPRSYGAAG